MDDDDPFGSYGLRAIRIEDKPVFDQLLPCDSTRLSDYTFANTFIWRDPIHLRWNLIHDCLCVFANGDGGLTMLFPPLGPGDIRAAAQECLAVCDAYNADAGLKQWTRVEYVSTDLRAKLREDFSAKPMSGDYVYATARMIDLAGGDLASKRQARNRFARRYHARTEPFGAQYLQPCLDLLAKWNHQAEDAAATPPGTENHRAVAGCGLRVAGKEPNTELPLPATENPRFDCAHRPEPVEGQLATIPNPSAVSVKRSKDVIAAGQAMRNYQALGLRGMVLFADDRLVGFTLGEMLSPDTCSIIIEKTDRDYTGSAQYIFSEFCRQYWPHTAWCNVGDDWEVPSLAWTKQSYRPAFRLEKWVLRPVGATIETAAALPAEDIAVATTV